MRRLTVQLSSFILAGLLATFGAACGDDDSNDNPGDGDGDGDIDAGDGDGDIDAGTDPDAAEAEILRSGTVAITETAVTNTGGVVSGAIVSVSFDDTETATVGPVEGFESNIFGCEIFVYDFAGGEREPDSVGENVISVSGTANGDFNCAFSNGAGQYLCQSTDAASASGDAEGAEFDGGAGVSTFLVPGATLSAAAVVGAQLVLSGFAGPLDGQRFPITERPSPGTLELATPDLSAVQVAGPAGAAYNTFIGAGPIPNPGGAYNFLDEKSEITISADGTRLVPEFEATVTPAGEGFTLVDDPKNNIYLPHQLPVTRPTTEVNFACNGDGCGSGGAGGELAAMVINGVTTDGPLPTANDPFGTAMPLPVTSYATFTCAFPAATEATIAADAMAVILDTNPTRIQTTVLRSQAFINITEPSDTADTALVAGHSFTGFTTVVPPKK